MNIKNSPPALPSRFEMLKPRISNLRMCQKASATGIPADYLMQAFERNFWKTGKLISE